MGNETLQSTCTQFLDSLLNSSTRHVLCLNISEPGFDAARVASDYLASKGKEVTELVEPTATQFGEALESIGGKTVVASFDDLDKAPKCIDLLAEHVKRPHPKGVLVVASRSWNSDNTAKERELRKACLFYQQNQAVKPKDSKK